MEYTRLLRPPQSRMLKSGKVQLMPGEQVGEHVTDNKEELILVMKGQATLFKAGEHVVVSAGESHFIPEGVTHNVINKGDSELEYVYVVTLFD